MQLMRSDTDRYAPLHARGAGAGGDARAGTVGDGQYRGRTAKQRIEGVSVKSTSADSEEANVANSEGALESRHKILVLLGCRCGDDDAVVEPLLWRTSSSHFLSGESERGGVYALRSPRLGRSGVGTFSSV